jgi:hypothetical protein
MINQQIRHLQSRDPFETFSIELASGRVIQIHDRHQVATTDGVQLGQAAIGVLYSSGTFELINATQVASVSVGLHPKVKEELAGRRERFEKMYEGKGAS